MRQRLKPAFFPEVAPMPRKVVEFFRIPARKRQGAWLFWIGLMALLGVWPPHSTGDPPRSGTRKDLTKADIDAMMQSLSNWGRWGKDDQQGALNLITPQKRKRASALVQD